MLLAEPEKYKDDFNEIKKDISYMTLKLKKTLGRKYYYMNESQRNSKWVLIFKK